MQYIQRLEAAVFKSRALNGKKKKDHVSEPDSPASIQFMALKKTLSNKIMSKVIQEIKKKGGRLSQKDLRETMSLLGPKVISAVLVDLGILTKAQQASLSRQLSGLLPKK